MTTQAHSGSCHCGAVKFTADVDLAKGTARCNCTLCTKARAWFLFVPPPALQVTSGADSLTEYKWVPPGKPGSFLHYFFCKTCGIRVFGRGGDEADPKIAFVNVGAFDDMSRDDLAAAPLRFVDGRHDIFDQPPADTRLM